MRTYIHTHIPIHTYIHTRGEATYIRLDMWFYDIVYMHNIRNHLNSYPGPLVWRLQFWWFVVLRKKRDSNRLESTGSTFDSNCMLSSFAALYLSSLWHTLILAHTSRHVELQLVFHLCLQWCCLINVVYKLGVATCGNNTKQSGRVCILFLPSHNSLL